MNLWVLLQNSEKFLFVSDKIYTVLTVVLIIWIGILIKLFLLEKKVKELEDKEKNQK
jgi:hypothetical protein